MRVAIDARKLHDFGIGTYIRNLLRQLARIDRQGERNGAVRDHGVAAVADQAEGYCGHWFSLSRYG